MATASRVTVTVAVIVAVIAVVHVQKAVLMTALAIEVAVAVIVLQTAQRMKTVARVWVTRLSVPSAKPLRMHSKP